LPLDIYLKFHKERKIVSAKASALSFGLDIRPLIGAPKLSVSLCKGVLGREEGERKNEIRNTKIFYFVHLVLSEVWLILTCFS